MKSASGVRTAAVKDRRAARTFEDSELDISVIYNVVPTLQMDKQG